MAEAAALAAPASDDGQIIGRYAVHGEIASGGMASVDFGWFLGPMGLSRPVAVKRLHRELARDSAARAMFLDEACLAARIQHPNVVATRDIVTDQGDLLVVMDYVHGESLQRLLRTLRERSEAVPCRIALAVAIGVLHGLHAAHEATSETGEPLRIVHRDVSPQNVMVGVDGSPRVVDFGVAHATQRLEHTQEGVIKGKLAYMAPEQLGGEPVDRRADIYSASVVLWQMLAGRRLFVRKDGATVVLDSALRATVAPPSQSTPDLPAELDSVLRGLAAAPDARFASAREMALALEKAGPIAQPSEVGQWVEELASDSLAERRSRLLELEMTSSTYRVHSIREVATHIEDATAIPLSQRVTKTRESSGLRPRAPTARTKQPSRAGSLFCAACGLAALVVAPLSAHHIAARAHAGRAASHGAVASIAPPASRAPGL